MPKHHRQRQVKDLPKVHTWRLEWDSNLLPSGRMALNLPCTTDVTWHLFLHMLANIIYSSVV